MLEIKDLFDLSHTDAAEYLKEFREVLNEYDCFVVGEAPMMTPKRVSMFTDELDHYNHGAQGVMRAKFLDFVKPDLRFRPVFNFKDFGFSKIH